MRDSRLSDFIRTLRARGGLATAALVLAMSLMAGLACEEDAPTETPAAPTQLGATGDDPDLAVGDVTAQAIALPVNQSIATTAPAPAFRINQTGSGPNGIFQISNTSNNQPALQALTNGRGRAGFFRTTNSLNSQPALQAQTNGTGVAIQGLATGTGGGAGNFQISNTSSVRDVLTATTVGKGRAAFFEVTNNTSTDITNAVEVRAHGDTYGLVSVVTGSRSAGRFISTQPAVDALHVLIVESASGNAAHFGGNVVVTGTLTKGAGSFRIDHPLDPEHKYLSHSFVESPDMMNVYNGNATLDENGRATVELPDYFEALNKDFRYQLTAIGAPGPNLYIAEGIRQNRFRIAGGRPYASVSWQVTGVRQDTYANEHRIKVEEDKPQADRNARADRLVARR